MGIIKILVWIAMIFIIIFTSILVYDNIPGKPIELKTQVSSPSQIVPSTDDAPMFLENMRFGHNNISYEIADGCKEERISNIKKAFEILENDVGIISFYETSGNADIDIGCSQEYIKVNNNFFTAGEGGPVEILKNGRFNLIKKGKIYLYKENYCTNPSIELHEMLHVFGFSHSNDSTNIMYNVTSCNQDLTSEIVDKLVKLYSIPILPDARIENLSVVKKGKYLDFNITISNDGIADIKNTSLVLFSDNKKIRDFPLGSIEMGFAKTLYSSNVRVPGDSNEIDFYVDYENVIEELDETNNYAKAG